MAMSLRSWASAEHKNNIGAPDEEYLDITKPSGAVAGDLLVGVFGCDRHPGTPGAFDFVARSPSTGWRRTVQTNIAGGIYTYVIVMEKIADGSEPATYRFDNNGGAGYDAGYGGVLMAFKDSGWLVPQFDDYDADTSPPIDHRCPEGFSTKVDEIVLRVAFAGNASSPSWLPSPESDIAPSGHTHVDALAAWSSINRDFLAVAYKMQAAIGSTGLADFNPDSEPISYQYNATAIIGTNSGQVRTVAMIG